MSSDGKPGEPVESVEQATMSVCPTATVEGLDVSASQGTVDWTAVQKSGRAFAFIKATQGDYYTSKDWASQWSGARTAGLLRSPYHFFDPTVDGVVQAKYFLNVVGTLGPGDLPPMLDIECPTASSQDASAPDCEYGGTSPDSGWVDAATLNQRIHDWLHYVAGQTGRTPIVYSYNAWFQDSGMDSTTLSGSYPFFVAWPTTTKCYTVGSGNSFTSAAFWQWNVTGSAPGVTGAVDLDRFVGTLEELRHLADLDVDGGGADGGDAGDGGDGGDAEASESGLGDASLDSADEADSNDEGGDAEPPLRMVTDHASCDCTLGGCTRPDDARLGFAILFGVTLSVGARRRGTSAAGRAEREAVR
jgi:GH25 family lysozyme M1 (1,4-beta-N-acetylmuramidase)